jgi:hypothetical protein
MGYLMGGVAKVSEERFADHRFVAVALVIAICASSRVASNSSSVALALTHLVGGGPQAWPILFGSTTIQGDLLNTLIYLEVLQDK